MAPEDGGRRCLRCDRHLVDLSELTEPQVEELRALARSGGAERMCAKVSLDTDGSPIYRQRAVRRLVQAAAGVVISVSVAACDTTGSDERATEPAAEMQPVPAAPDRGTNTEPTPAEDHASAAAGASTEIDDVATTDTPDPDTTEAEVVDTPAARRPRPRTRPRAQSMRDEELVGLVDL
jgi:hypothetical protein